MVSRSLILLVRAFVLMMTLATLIAAVPAFAADACATAPGVAVEQALDDANPCGECPDCGPACEAGCCHAAHPAVPGPAEPQLSAPSHEGAPTWLATSRPPLQAPSGPERPPRA